MFFSIHYLDFRRTHEHTTPALHCQLNVSAMGLILLMALIAIWGLKQSSLVNTITMFIKFGALLFFLIYSFIKFHPEYLTPMFPYEAEGVFRVCVSCMHVMRVWHMDTSLHVVITYVICICVAITIEHHIWYFVSSHKYANINYLCGFICLLRKHSFDVLPGRCLDVLLLSRVWHRLQVQLCEWVASCVQECACVCTRVCLIKHLMPFIRV